MSHFFLSKPLFGESVRLTASRLGGHFPLLRTINYAICSLSLLLETNKIPMRLERIGELL